MAYFPVFTKLTDEAVVVIGGGNIALRKVAKLMDFDCRITVIAPEVAGEIRKFADDDRISLLLRRYEGATDITDAAIVIAATNNRELNALVAGDAKTLGIPINVVDDKQLSTFYFPALVKKDNIVIGIGTSGENPALSGAIRAKLDVLIDDIIEEVV